MRRGARLRPKGREMNAVDSKAKPTGSCREKLRRGHQGNQSETWTVAAVGAHQYRQTHRNLRLRWPV